MESAIADPKASRLGTERSDGPLVAAARTVELTAREVKEKVVATKEKLEAKSIGQLVNDGRRVVSENPVKVVLVSVGVGALIGYLIGRRRA